MKKAKTQRIEGTNVLYDLAVQVILDAPEGEFSTKYDMPFIRLALEKCFARNNSYKTETGSPTMVGYMTSHCVNVGLFEKVNEYVYKLTSFGKDMKKRLQEKDESTAENIRRILKNEEKTRRNERENSKPKVRIKKTQNNGAVLSFDTPSEPSRVITPIVPVTPPVVTPRVEKAKIQILIPTGNNTNVKMEFEDTPEIRAKIMSLL